MASPTDYIRAANGRRSTSADLVANDRGPTITPNRAGSPESEDAVVLPDTMISRNGDKFLIPAAWMDQIADNDDPLLNRGDGLKLYDALLDDETAMSTLQQRRLAITSRDHEVAAGDDSDPRSVKAADDFRAMVAQLSFDRITGGLHYGVWYGYAIGEGMFEMRLHDGRMIVWLNDIVVPDRRHFGFTERGELRFVGTMSSNGEVLPDNKFVSIRTGATNDFAFYGMGLAHWCYWPIFFKRSVLKFWALYLEKLGRPTVVVGFSPEDKDDKTKQAKLLQAAMAIGEDSAVSVPKEYLENDLIKIMESTRSGSGAQGYREMIEWAEEAIMRVVLGSPGTTKATPGGIGGDGQAKKDEGVKAEIVKADSDLISEGLYKFATWLTRWNHGPDVAPPKIYRILDDAEDLNTVADRDVKLNGIGIKRTEKSVADVYGDGYEVDRVSTAEQAAIDNAAAAAKAGLSAPGGNVVPIKPDAKAEFQAFNPALIEFTAADDEAIGAVVAAASVQGAAMIQRLANAFEAGLDGITSAEAARVAILSVVEQFSAEDWAKELALPLIAERGAAMIGESDAVLP